MREIVFTHSGSLGDILFSLHFIRDYSEWRGADRAHMLLTYGKPAVHGEGHPDGDVQMSEGSAKFIIPFLRESGLFADVQAVEWAKVEQIRGQIDGCVDLDEFRRKRISFLRRGQPPVVLRPQQPPLQEGPQREPVRGEVRRGREGRRKGPGHLR